MELTDITGVGPSRADDLVELGFETVESIAEAEPDALTDLNRVGEDKALEMIVDAQNVLDEGEESVEEEESITFDEEKDDSTANEVTEEEPEIEEESLSEDEEVVEEDLSEDEEEESEEAGPEEYEIYFELTDEQHEVLITALLDSHTDLMSNNRSRSMACKDVLTKLRDGSTMHLTREELNAVHAAMRERRLSYQGNNHIDLMHEAMAIEEQVAAARQEYL